MAYSPRKAAQSIAFFALNSRDNSINVLKAVKLIYLADRESISRWGTPIQNEKRVSMPHGPVNSSTYSYINGDYELSETGWSDFLEDRANHCVALAHNNITVEDLDELSEADILCLKAVWDKFGKMSKWQLRDWTHQQENIPEWEDPNGSSKPIPLEKILYHTNVENSTKQATLIESYDNVDAIFNSLK